MFGWSKKRQPVESRIMTPNLELGMQVLYEGKSYTVLELYKITPSDRSALTSMDLHVFYEVVLGSADGVLRISPANTDKFVTILKKEHR